MEGGEIFFLVIGSFIGAALVAAFSRSALRSLLRGNWEIVSGRVIRAVVEEYKDIQQSTQHNVRVEYEYKYGAVLGKGRAFVGHSQLDRFHARELAEKYPAGHVLKVYVYKKDPTETKLYAGINFISLVAVIFGAGLVVFFSYRLTKLL